MSIAITSLSQLDLSQGVAFRDKEKLFNRNKSIFNITMVASVVLGLVGSIFATGYLAAFFLGAGSIGFISSSIFVIKYLIKKSCEIDFLALKIHDFFKRYFVKEKFFIKCINHRLEKAKKIFCEKTKKRFLSDYLANLMLNNPQEKEKIINKILLKGKNLKENLILIKDENIMKIRFFEDFVREIIEEELDIKKEELEEQRKAKPKQAL